MHTSVPSRNGSTADPGLVPRPAHRRVLAVVLAALTAALVVFATAAPAAAHDQLLSTDPEAGATLEKAPESLELTFSGDIQDIGHEIHVTDSRGGDVTQGTVGVEGKTVSQPLRDNGGEDETYTVVWRVVSQDGHPIEGSFRYDVGAGSATAATRDASAAPENTEAAAGPTAEAGGTGLPGWALPVIGGAFALVVLIGVLFVATRPKQR